MSKPDTAQDKTTAYREAFIPASKRALVKAAAADLTGSADPQAGSAFANVCNLLSATLHYDYFDEQEAMREAYAPFDPDAEQGPSFQGTELDGAWARFDKAFAATLAAANFEEIDAGAEALAAMRESESGVRVKTSAAGLRMIRHFVRNRRRTKLQRKRFWGLRTETIDADVFGDVVMLVGFKAAQDLTPKERAAMAKGAKTIRPNCAIVKQFKNIARGDLISLHPGAKTTMKRSDQVILAAPALFGGVPLLMNLLPALSVLFVVIGAYLGFQGGQVTHDSTRKALAALSGVAAAGAFMMRQRLKYEAQSLRYQKKLSENVYYRNVANNVGVFDVLINSAEEQEFKEAVTAYQRLLTQGPMSKDALDKSCEAWISAQFNARINFDVDDAAGKLLRMGLVKKDQDIFTATPLNEALENLDKAWDALFNFRRDAAPRQA